MSPEASQTLVKSVGSWKRYYQELFNFDLKEALIPEPSPAFDQKQLIIRVPSFSAKQIIDRIKTFYDVFVWTGRDLDKVLNQSESIRSAAESPYGIFVEPSEDPDFDMWDMSLEEQKCLGVTLEERLHLDLFRWWSTRTHLDRRFRTICSGSSYDNGMPPVVGFDERYNRLIIDCLFDPGKAHERYCGRKVIAAPEIPQLGVVYH